MIVKKTTLFALIMTASLTAQSPTTPQPAQSNENQPPAKGEPAPAPPKKKAADQQPSQKAAAPQPARKETGQQAAQKSVAEASEALNAGKTPAAATIDAFMEQAVLNIAARYNLNEHQTEVTRRLMTRDVYRFLEEHEAEVWPVIRDLLTSQLGAKPPDAKEEVMRIGKAARPLMQLAKDAILRANDEWRDILTPDQKLVHDFDLKEMKVTFDQIDKNFADWEMGQAPSGPIISPPQLGEDQPRRPKKPAEEEPIKVVFEPHRVLETLVEEFIKDYELDEGQITAARSILQEFKTKASDFTDAKRTEFTEIAKQQQEAITKHDLDGIKKAATARKKLLEPVSELCAQMHERLKGLLTSAQLERYAQKASAPKKGVSGNTTVAKESSSKKEPAAPPPPSEPPQKDAVSPETVRKDASPPKAETPPAAPGAQEKRDKPADRGEGD